MAYDVPEGTDDLSIAIKTTIANALDHIKSSVSAQHGWSDSTAASCVHNRGSGIIVRVDNAVAGDVEQELAFTPTLVLFDYIYLDTTSRCNGHGWSDGTNHKSCIIYGTANTVGNNTGYCIFAPFNTAGFYQRATCAMGANKFTLTWSINIGAQAGDDIYIRYMAFG